MNMNMNIKQRHSLKTRVTLFTLIIFVISILALALYASRVLRDDMERQLGEQQFSTATIVAAHVNDELEERIKVLELVASFITPGMLQNSSSVQKFLDQEIVIHPHFNGGVFVLSHEGIAIADSPIFNGRVGVNFMDRKFAIGVLSGGKPTIGDPVMGKALKSHVFSIAVPIRNAQGKVIAALAGTTDLAKPNFLDKITESHYGKTGGYLLIAEERRMIVTATDKDRIMQALPALGVNPAIDRFIQGYEGSNVIVNPLGVEVLASAKGIPVAGWYMVASLPTAEAFAPIRFMQQRMLLVALTLAVLACILAWWMMRRQFSPMLEAAKALAALSSSNQYHQPLPVTSHDEIGELIVGFNQLLETLGQQKVALLEKEERYRILVEWTPEAIIVHRGGKVLYVNPAMIKMFGASSAQDLIGKSIFELIHPDYHQVVLDRMKKNLSDGIAAPVIEEKFIKLDGTIIDVEVQGTAINYDGEPAFHASLRDITERKQIEEKLRITAGVFDISQEAILITNANNIIIDVNPAFTTITGYSRDEVIGKNPKMLSSGRQGKGFYAKMWQSINQERAWRGELWNRRKSGEIYPEMLSISVLCNSDGTVLRNVAVFSDISRFKEHEAELSRVAHFDALTGIPNRVLLADRMKQAIAQASREQNMMAVCYLDLDGFKPVNDDMGHDAGDRVLIEIAKRIESCIRGGDTVARLGGDEFVVLLLGQEKGETSVAMIERMLSSISRPIVVDGGTVTLSASIGVSIYPLDDADPDTLLRHADQAMYLAKQSGKNCFHIYDVALDRHGKELHAFLQSIRYGLENEQFELYYQPKVDLRTKELVGAEALIRWKHPERGLLPPAEFLRQIDNTELDIQLGEWVTATALAQLSHWRKAGLDIEVSINISGYHMESAGFVGKLQQQLAAYPDMPQGKLQIEVLETVALNDTAIVRGIIESCRQLGIGFALDDFGTGYSSLSYLSSLPVDTLKIDQSFVRDMLVDKGDMAIVQGIIALARAFDRNTVAEGIETEEHYQALLDMGCEVGQGYVIVRPMPAGDLINWRDRKVI
jgi:diguanylate cyclase (GGDEF)-like protein/PAS domain S-box-containing protein